MMTILAVFSGILLVASSQTSDGYSNTPSNRIPLPRQGYEFGNAIQRSHVTTAQCLGTEAVVRWKFKMADNQSIVDTHPEVTELKFAGKIAGQVQLGLINRRLKTIIGDAFFGVYCNNEVATISLIEASAAGTARAKVIRFDWVDGQARFHDVNGH